MRNCYLVHFILESWLSIFLGGGVGGLGGGLGDNLEKLKCDGYGLYLNFFIQYGNSTMGRKYVHL